MTRVRGPMSPIRPGPIIKDSLERRGEASINELHNDYKDEVRQHNADQPPAKKRQPMAYLSFVRYVQAYRAKGFVRTDRYEPMLLPPADPNPLVGVEDGLAGRVVVARRAIIVLTAQGEAATNEWLTKV